MILISEHSFSLSVPFLPVSVVGAFFLVSHLADPVPQIVFELAFIDVSVLMSVFPLARSQAFFEVSFISVSIWVGCSGLSFEVS